MKKRYSLISILVVTSFCIFTNCSTSEAVLTGNKVNSNKGIITVSELSTEDSNVQTVATFKDSILIEYPKMCWDYKNEGTVKLFMDINEQGSSTNTKVTRGIGFGCDEAAWEAMNNASYNPALDADGNPVSAIHNVTVIFKR